MLPITKTIKNGVTLFHENDRSRELYLIQSGQVKVFRTIAGREIELASLGKGSVLGEMALIDGKPRSASAKTTTESSVILIDADTFYTKIKGVPPWFMSIIRMVSQKIRNANRRLEHIQDDKNGITIILAMQHCLYHYRTAESQTCTVDLQGIKKNLSQLLAISSQRVLGIIEFLGKHELIEISGDSITVKNLDYFSSYCTFLRQYLRKAYDRISPLTPKTIGVLSEVAKQFPDMDKNTKPIELDATRISEMANSDSPDDTAAIIDALKNYSLATSKKSESSSEGNPSGLLLTVNKPVWKLHTTFYTFQPMLPNL
jgi:CRP-like cAMP-binding protein